MRHELPKSPNVGLLTDEWNATGPFAVVFVGEADCDTDPTDGKFRYYKLVDATGENPNGPFIPFLSPWACTECN